MPRYSVPLKAGKETRLPYAGKVLQIIDTGVAPSVKVQVEWGGDQQATEDYGDCTDRFRIKGEGTQRFAALTLTSATDTLLDLLVSNQDVTASVVDGSTINATVLNAALAITAAQLPGALEGGRLAVAAAAAAATVDRSGVTTAGGALAAVAANAARRGFWFQCKYADCWLNTTAAATGDHPDLFIPAGAIYEAPSTGVPTGSVSVYCASAAKFAAREW